MNKILKTYLAIFNLKKKKPEALLTRPMTDEEIEALIQENEERWFGERIIAELRDKLNRINEIVKNKVDTQDEQVLALRKEYENLQRMSHIGEVETYKTRIDLICDQAKSSTLEIICQSEEWKKTKMPNEWVEEYWKSGLSIEDFAKDRKTKLVAHIFGF